MCFSERNENRNGRTLLRMRAVALALRQPVTSTRHTGVVVSDAEKKNPFGLLRKDCGNVEISNDRKRSGLHLMSRSVGHRSHEMRLKEHDLKNRKRLGVLQAVMIAIAGSITRMIGL